ncbi:AraC-like DNA-binding protein [Bradyrhizobium sp. USDA 4503]
MIGEATAASSASTPRQGHDYLQSKAGNVKILHLYITYGPETSNQIAADTFADWPYLGGIPDPLVAQIGAAIAEELLEETGGGELLLDTLKDALIARISRRIQRANMTGGSGRNSMRGLDSARLTRVLDFLNGSIEERPSLADIAKTACLSRYHFVRAFKVATGQTPYQYLSGLRLDRARELLSCEQESIDNIANRLQFSNSANFCRAFRRNTGFSPTAYRNRFTRRRLSQQTHGTSR